MRIAVTGVSGQLGDAIARELSPQHDIVPLDRNALDLNDCGAIPAVISAIKPDIFIHCAAYTQVDAAENDRVAAFRVNAEAPALIARSCNQIRARLIHFSTDYVFDGSARRPYAESDPTNPINVYGQSKLEGEKAVLESGADALIVRTGWVYSTHGQNFFRTMLRLGAECEMLRVVNDQTGSPTSAASIAQAIANLVASDVAASGIYHLTSAGETTWHGFATEIFRLAREHPTVARNYARREMMVKKVVPISTAEYPTAAARPKYSVLDNRKFQQDFGFEMADWKRDLEKLFAAGDASRTSRHSGQ